MLIKKILEGCLSKRKSCLKSLWFYHFVCNNDTMLAETTCCGKNVEEPNTEKECKAGDYYNIPSYHGHVQQPYLDILQSGTEETCSQSPVLHTGGEYDYAYGQVPSSSDSIFQIHP